MNCSVCCKLHAVYRDFDGIRSGAILASLKNIKIFVIIYIKIRKSQRKNSEKSLIPYTFFKERGDYYFYC